MFLEPVPAARPRVSKWGTYYPKTYKAFIAAAEKAIPQPDAPYLGDLKVTLDFYCRRPATTKRSNPRGDIDNYCKAILDALTKAGWWGDDDQIVTLHANKWFADCEEPHTRITIERT